MKVTTPGFDPGGARLGVAHLKSHQEGYPGAPVSGEHSTTRDDPLLSPTEACAHTNIQPAPTIQMTVRTTPEKERTDGHDWSTEYEHWEDRLTPESSVASSASVDEIPLRAPAIDPARRDRSLQTTRTIGVKPSTPGYRYLAVVAPSHWESIATALGQFPRWADVVDCGHLQPNFYSCHLLENGDVTITEEWVGLFPQFLDIGPESRVVDYAGQQVYGKKANSLLRSGAAIVLLSLFCGDNPEKLISLVLPTIIAIKFATAFKARLRIWFYRGHVLGKIDRSTIERGREPTTSSERGHDDVISHQPIIGHTPYRQTVVAPPPTIYSENYSEVPSRHQISLPTTEFDTVAENPDVERSPTPTTEAQERNFLGEVYANPLETLPATPAPATDPLKHTSAPTDVEDDRKPSATLSANDPVEGELLVGFSPKGYGIFDPPAHQIEATADQPPTEFAVGGADYGEDDDVIREHDYASNPIEYYYFGYQQESVHRFVERLYYARSYRNEKLSIWTLVVAVNRTNPRKGVWKLGPASAAMRAYNTNWGVEQMRLDRIRRNQSFRQSR